jgi:hypothetical protein
MFSSTQAKSTFSAVNGELLERVNNLLKTAGICSIPNMYTAQEIAGINAAIEPILASRLEERRAYVHPDELVELGVMNQLFNEQMMNTLFTIMPDPVLYHCHVYEIAANDSRSHIFSDSLLGWHRDDDSFYIEEHPTHVSLFVYLSTVGKNDGAFEFMPDVSPSKWMLNGDKYISVQGEPGYSFAWQRSYYHRASPNRGPVRRRLFKISIQRNSFISLHLGNAHFSKVLTQIPPGNVQWDLLLGRYQGADAPKLPSPVPPAALPIATNNTLSLPTIDLAKVQMREKVQDLKRKIKGNTQPVVAAYD